MASNPRTDDERVDAGLRTDLAALPRRIKHLTHEALTLMSEADYEDFLTVWVDEMKLFRLGKAHGTIRTVQPIGFGKAGQPVLESTRRPRRVGK